MGKTPMLSFGPAVWRARNSVGGATAEIRAPHSPQNNAVGERGFPHVGQLVTAIILPTVRSTPQQIPPRVRIGLILGCWNDGRQRIEGAGESVTPSSVFGDSAAQAMYSLDFSSTQNMIDAVQLRLCRASRSPRVPAAGNASVTGEICGETDPGVAWHEGRFTVSAFRGDLKLWGTMRVFQALS